ncbi:MAG: CBS domain-containing protein [Candidatus Omnitrophica bacterium]|nr:CBS domain-containing protein [Candidatus Omnitrophota bacterium]NUP93521.1 CBS domain-containing protein [Candidatus Omnitrophota bacterium]
MTVDGSAPITELKLDRKDFVSDQEVRWCPGCGDYSILAQVQKVVPTLGIPRENFVFVSGIGCSSRFPYYMNTYGFHSIHGRAPAVATGVKLANPHLSVWVITGDGDGLSIGGNHLIHAIRRNIDINIILFNNRIYGLTKGQYSPTSDFGKKTKSTPYGSIDQPINPLCVAIASEATFVARSIDIDTQHLTMVLERAARHKGISFVEVYQNCNIFNDGAFAHFTDRQFRSDRVLYLEHGKPMTFGKDLQKGIRLNNLNPEVVELGRDYSPEDLLVHDEAGAQPTLAYLLTRMHYPDFPVPMGVFRCVETREYSDLLTEQIEEVSRKEGKGNLDSLLAGDETWVIEEEGATLESVSGRERPGEDEESYHPANNLDAHEEPKCAIRRSVLNDRIGEVRPDPPIIASPADSIQSAIERMARERRGAVCVVEKDELVGIFTERDVLMRVALKGLDLEKTPISSVMTSNPITLKADATLAYALNQMAVAGFRHLPLMDGKKAVGMVSVKDVVRYMSENMAG